MAGSVYQQIRRRIAPIAIVLAFGLLIFDTCGKKERIDATIILDLGPASEQVSRVEVDVLVGGEPVVTFARDRDGAGVMSNPRFTATVTEPDATLAIRLHVPGRVVATRKAIVVETGAVITIPLADLVGPAPPR